MEFTGHLVAEWIETLPKIEFATQTNQHSLQILPSRGRYAVCKHINRNIGKTEHSCTNWECYLHPDCSNKFHLQYTNEHQVRWRRYIHLLEALYNAACFSF
jgi:hypothetical protein